MKAGYLSEEILKELTNPQLLNNGEATDYGIGWFIGETNGKSTIGHGGGSIGGITDFVVFPEEELVIAILSNSSDTRFGDVLDRIVAIFLEAE